MSKQISPAPWGKQASKASPGQMGGIVTVIDATGNDVCEMGGNTNDGTNADLIVSAPKLLKALTRLLSANRGHDNISIAMHEADLAIAEVTRGAL